MQNLTDLVAANYMYHHILTESQVYPSLAAGATVVTAAADWTYGAYAVIVPATTIASAFHIHHFVIESCDQNDVFQLQIYKGAADDVVSTIRFSLSGGFWGNMVYLVSSELCDANSQVRARLACSNGLAAQATITMSITYVLE
jgi:hypothetical protein